MTTAARKFLLSLLDSLKSAPVESVLSVCAALLVSLSIEDAFDHEHLPPALVSIALAWAMAFAATMLHRVRAVDGRTRWAMTLASVVLAFSYGYLLADFDRITEAWRAGVLLGAAALLPTLTPLAAKMGSSTPSERFWRFNMRLGFRVLASSFYVGAMTIGCLLGLGAIGELFEVNFSDELFAHTATWIALGIGPLLVTGGAAMIAKIDEDLPEPTIRWIARLGTYLFAPLVVLYLAIGYAYLTRVALTGVLPSNVLSPLVLGAGLLGYFGTFVLLPFATDAGSRLLRNVLRAFPTAFLPLVPLGLWAVWVRIEQYGWTEFRYFRLLALLCLTGFALWSTVRLIRRQELSVLGAPVIAVIALAASTIGPWSATDISRRSQQARLVEAAIDLEALGSDGRLLPKEELQSMNTWDLYEPAHYLVEHHGIEALQPYTPTDLGASESSWDALTALGIETDDYMQSFHVDVDSESTPPVIDHPGAMIAVDLSAGSARTRSGLTSRIVDHTIEVQWHGQQGVIDLTRAMAHDWTSDRIRRLSADSAVFPIVMDGVVAGQFVLTYVSGTRGAGKTTITYVQGTAFLPPKHLGW